MIVFLKASRDDAEVAYVYGGSHVHGKLCSREECKRQYKTIINKKL